MYSVEYPWYTVGPPLRGAGAGGWSDDGQELQDGEAGIEIQDGELLIYSTIQLVFIFIFYLVFYLFI